MRPLVVLLLVVGALAALLFALSTLSDGGRHPVDHPITVSKAATVPETPVNLDPVIPPTRDETKPPTEGVRQAVGPGDENKFGPKVQFGAIEGLVVDEQGQPIADAHVSLLNMRPNGMEEDIAIMKGSEPPRPVEKKVTDAKGTFRFEQLDPRKPWTVVVTHDKYIKSSPDTPCPVPEGGVWKELVTLKAAQATSGYVRAAQGGQPIAGALLVLDSPLAYSTKKKNIGQLRATTDETGQYTFTNPGSLMQARVLTVSAPGYATQVHTNYMLADFANPPTRFKNVQSATGTMQMHQQDFELEPGKIIAGRVLGPERKGVVGIEIQALNQSGTIGSQGETKSGASGEFLIEGLAEGIYTVRVTPGQYDAIALQRVEAGDTNVVIQLFEQGTVTGKVVDPSGQPLSTFTVKARVSNEVSKAYGAVMGQKKGSKDGSFEIGGLAEQTYVIEALAPGFASSFSEPFTVTQGLMTTDIVVRMSPGGTLSGLILDSYNKAPLAGAEVATYENEYIENDIFELFSQLEPSAMTKAKVYTDEEGRFQVELMTPGQYQIQVRAKGYAPVYIHDVTIVDGAHTEMPTQELKRGARVEGLVYGREGAICPGASVQLSPADANELNGGRTTRSDSSGHFLLENLEPGSYTLSATRPNSNAGNPFEAIGDMRQSQIEISVEDGMQYTFELHMSSVRGN